jgi:hypothetical protein
MGYGYQKRDYEIVDYQLWTIPEFERPFRGPKPDKLEPGKYFSCLGGAQTFGCFTEKPFPQLLSEKISMNVFNLGNAGAGPAFYLNGLNYFDWINQSAFAIVQIMSGRSESNSYFLSPKGRGKLQRVNDGRIMLAELAYDELLLNEPEEMVVKLVKETRENYLSRMIELLDKITVPKILLWFSERSPNYIENCANAKELFGKYPQLVNQAMVQKLIPFADKYVEIISNEGMPQKLVSRFTGEIPTVCIKGMHKKKRFNNYYPSPEMHIKAFEGLFQVCNSLLSKTI